MVAQVAGTVAATELSELGDWKEPAVRTVCLALSHEWMGTGVGRNAAGPKAEDRLTAPGWTPARSPVADSNRAVGVAAWPPLTIGVPIQL